MFQRISIDEAKALMSAEECQLIDIRDIHSFTTSHIPQASHIDGNSIDAFIESADKSLPLVIYCYHGNSSQSAARYFAEQQFQRVYSLDGGFEAWRQTEATE